MGDDRIEPGTVRSGYNSGVDKMAGYLPKPKNCEFFRQDEKRYNDQITREIGQITDQRAQLIFSQHQTLNRSKDKKRRPNDQQSEKRTLDARSFIGLDKARDFSNLNGGPPSKISLSLGRFASAISHSLHCR